VIIESLPIKLGDSKRRFGCFYLLSADAFNGLIKSPILMDGAFEVEHRLNIY
jgi:hypothetical protein